ncbi:DUF5713 family protein [Variovorax paradoxus]|uniref:DUF5713 family protein n=1 Tax=Variovorax paradoxus TaxID=34073 RepID=UPI003D657BBD
MPIKNTHLRDFEFLREMREDADYPPHLVDRGVALLVRLCEEIEEKKPADLKQLYSITLETMVLFHDLYDEFLEEGCEIEAIGQGIVGSDIFQIADAYGFDADYEELIAVSAFSLSSQTTETFDALVRLFFDEEDSGAVQIASATRNSPS